MKYGKISDIFHQKISKIAKFISLTLLSEPSTRGILVSLTFISVTLGMFLVLLLNTLMPWRTIALVCLIWPVITAIAICFVSQTIQII